MTPELTLLKSTVEDALTLHLPTESTLAQSVVDAMRHTVLGGGKRVRPLLLASTCTGLGGNLEDTLEPACAIEFMHAYSLIHDDLPAMDNDVLRHGLPSSHIAFGEATAILAGDALQALAFDTLSHATGLDAKTRLSCISLLAHAAGWQGMVGGQSFDMQAEGVNLSLSQLQSLHACKTGALIKASVQIGALIAQTSGERFVLLSEFADRIGLAFQVIDDVLDVTATDLELGKPSGSDHTQHKSTFVTLMGTEQARDTARELLKEAMGFLRRAGLGISPLADLAQFVVTRKS